MRKSFEGSGLSSLKPESVEPKSSILLSVIFATFLARTEEGALVAISNYASGVIFKEGMERSDRQ